jgi:hypothetical protein
MDIFSCLGGRRINHTYALEFENAHLIPPDLLYDKHLKKRSPVVDAGDQISS